MKRIISLLIIISLLMINLTSCKKEPVIAPTCDELIAAYKEAGYNVFHCDQSEYKEDSLDEDCYVKIWLDDEYEYIYFNFFESEESAEAFDAEREFNIIIYLFTIIFGDPTWLYTKTYGNIQYEYEDDGKHMLKPFKELIND